MGSFDEYGPGTDYDPMTGRNAEPMGPMRPPGDQYQPEDRSDNPDDIIRYKEDERQEVRLHFDRLQEEKRAQMEAAMPAPDHDWGIGICDLNVKQLEKRFQKLERGEKPQSEDCAIAAEISAAGKARGRNRQATTGVTDKPEHVSPASLYRTTTY